MKRNLFIVSLTKTVLCYVFLTVGYYLFLRYFQKPGVSDPLTCALSQQVAWLLQCMGNAVTMVQDTAHSYIWVYFNGKYTTIIDQGCNGVSVIILFLSIVIGIGKNWKYSILYGIVGVILLHSINIIRISVLNYISQDYPHSLRLYHDIIFPIIMYVSILVLWYFWLQFNGYSLFKKVTYKEFLLKSIGIGVLLLALVAIRFFEDTLFYDPVLDYYKGGKIVWKELDFTKLYSHTVLRYVLNGILSLGVIWIAFRSTKFIKISLLVIIFVGVIGMLTYMYNISGNFILGEPTGFYIRRILIQPMILLFITPVFLLVTLSRD